MVAGAADPQPSPNTFVHGESAMTGRKWESQGLISFDKLKLTNNRASIVQGQICLHSMHKYWPKVHVQAVPDGVENSGELVDGFFRKSVFLCYFALLY